MTWLQLLRLEFRAILSDFSVAFTIFGGIVAYSFLYPLPYSNQVPREQHTVIVNEDGSQLSRKLERMLDATPEVKVVKRVHTIAEARTMLLSGEAGGILVIPSDFYRDLLLGKSPVLGYAGNASYFLIYSTVVEGMAKAAGTLGAEVKVLNHILSGDALPRAEKQYSPLQLNVKPVFNTTMGYVNYVVPAVFVLILHQTLLMAVGELGSHQNHSKKRSEGYWLQVPIWRLLIVRVLTFGGIYALGALYYFGFAFEFYDITRLASPLELWGLIIPFILSVIALGVVLGQLIRRPEILSLLVLLSSLILAFSAGFIWPLSSVPPLLVWLTNLVPSTPAIQSFLMLNQMGADFSQILPQYSLLWLQTIGYGGLAYWLLNRRDIEDA
ncbi:ABC transporter permease [Corallincola luteus]|uniref:ABC transporter permease n=1 Tax=Corallincola luteus TaxID=1775177 RepID=A0ABY2AKK3_9GAMM|nr:ABC transporter permease [Corallincola luteus]TCI03164.1 ABC transporter permease [Corallincola luteus]